MIPFFPVFKNLEFSDKEQVEDITLKHAPYSDFNFVSMWLWDINHQIQISQLNGNIVICLPDYLNGDPAFSFLGNHLHDDTLQKVISYAKTKTGKGLAKYLPDDVVKDLDRTKFVINEDRDNFDYIYSIDDLVALNGHKYESKRGFIHRFLKKYPGYSLRNIDLTDHGIQKMIIELDNLWIENKLSEGKNPQSANESLAIERLLLAANKLDLVSYGIFIKDELVGFSINEYIKKSDYVISHFMKGDSEVVGVYAMLMNQGCVKFLNDGKRFFNFEQDLGLPGLRKSKESYRPSTYLRKYQVTELLNMV